MNCLEIIANIDLTRSPRNVNKVYADKMWEDLEKSSILYPRSDYFISELALIGDILSKDWHMHLLIIKNIEKR